ncbi:MAG TPA: hypothetical protein DEO92_04755, partial [Phycisphaerales bacterium]|nr:hypothetical protein [Phycisphaerales bacterium]
MGDQRSPWGGVVALAAGDGVRASVAAAVSSDAVAGDAAFFGVDLADAVIGSRSWSSCALEGLWWLSDVAQGASLSQKRPRAALNG